MNKELENNPEFLALQELESNEEGVDPIEIMGEAGVKKEEKEGGEKPPETPKPPDEGGEGGEPPAPETGSQNELLKEIFGDRFKSVEEAKKVIPDVFQQIETLRQEKENLEKKLQEKPKTDFADDEVALYNEFVRNTGVKSYDLFRRINEQDIDAMDDLDKLVLKKVIENPKLIGQEDKVRAYLEKRYGLTEGEFEPEEIEINKIGLASEVATVTKELKEMKENLKVPEPATKEIPPEEVEKMKEDWKKVGTVMIGKIKEIPVPVNGSDTPLMTFKIPEEQLADLENEVAEYAVKNGFELNEKNVKAIGNIIYNMAVISNFDKIVKSVFEKARSMTAEEVHSFYENPSPLDNKDTPPVPPEPEKSEHEKAQDEVFEAEMKRGGF